MKTFMKQLAIAIICLSVAMSASAQADLRTVPDVTGVSVALAAARLNQAGFALGSESARLWIDALNQPPGSVVAQAVPVGTVLEAGSAIDITVLRPANLVAVYDDNDLTLINRGSSPLDLSSLVFASVDGAPATFAATRWAATTLAPGRCVQVWSISRGGPKDVEGCQGMQYWLTTNNPQEHFWTGQGGTTQFSIAQAGNLSAVCAVSSTGRCELYTGEVSADAGTPFVHFSYARDWLVVHNTSADQWMNLQDFIVYNFNVPQAGLGLQLSDVTMYNQLNPLGSVGRLAPGQCLLFHSVELTTLAGQIPDCLPMGTLQIDATVKFWGAAFEMNSQLDGRRRACPAADAERVTVCIMPR